MDNLSFSSSPDNSASPDLGISSNQVDGQKILNPFNKKILDSESCSTLPYNSYSGNKYFHHRVASLSGRLVSESRDRRSRFANLDTFFKNYDRCSTDGGACSINDGDMSVGDLESRKYGNSADVVSHKGNALNYDEDMLADYKARINSLELALEATTEHRTTANYYRSKSIELEQELADAISKIEASSKYKQSNSLSNRDTVLVEETLHTLRDEIQGNICRDDMIAIIRQLIVENKLGKVTIQEMVQNVGALKSQISESQSKLTNCVEDLKKLESVNLSQSRDLLNERQLNAQLRMSMSDLSLSSASSDGADGRKLDSLKAQLVAMENALNEKNSEIELLMRKADSNREMDSVVSSHNVLVESMTRQITSLESANETMRSQLGVAHQTNQDLIESRKEVSDLKVKLNILKNEEKVNGREACGSELSCVNFMKDRNSCDSDEARNINNDIRKDVAINYFKDKIERLYKFINNVFGWKLSATFDNGEMHYYVSPLCIKHDGYFRFKNSTMDDSSKYMMQAFGYYAVKWQTSEKWRKSLVSSNYDYSLWLLKLLLDEKHRAESDPSWNLLDVNRVENEENSMNNDENTRNMLVL